MAATSEPPKVRPERPGDYRTPLPDTPDRAFLRGAQDGAVQSHYRAWIREQNVPDTPETRVAFAQSLTPQQVAVYSKDDSVWARSFWREVGKKLKGAPVVRTMGDVVRGQVKQKQATQASQTAPGTSRRRTRDTGIPGIAGRVDTRGSARGADTAGELGVLTGEWLLRNTEWGRRLLERAYPTAAGSTVARSRTNRTGAGATRAPVSTGSGVRPAPTGTAQGVSGRGTGGLATVPGIAGQVQTPRSAVGSGGRSVTNAITREAQRGYEQLTALTNQALRALNQTTSRFVQGARGAMRSGVALRTSSASSTRATALAPDSSTSSSTSMGQRQTLVAGSGGACRCPPPPKKKRGSPKCTNPVVSRRRKGDLIITTRRAQCP